MPDIRPVDVLFDGQCFPFEVKMFGEKKNVPLVLLNTWGMSGYVVEQLAAALSSQFYVAVWCEHYVDTGERAVSLHELDIPFRVSAYKQITDALEFPEDVHVVTWCAGAYTLCEVMAQGLGAPGRVVLISPSDMTGDKHRTDYQTKFLPMLATAHDASDSRCEIMRKAISGTVGKVAQIEPGRDAAISAASSYYTSDPTKFRNYARCVNQILDYRDTFPKKIRPTFSARQVHIIQAIDDVYINFKDSLEATRELPQATLSLISSGGHFLPATRTDEIKNLVSSTLLGE